MQSYIGTIELELMWLACKVLPLARYCVPDAPLPNFLWLASVVCTSLTLGVSRRDGQYRDQERRLSKQGLKIPKWYPHLET
ncbi:c-14 sterol reductase [Moniliophthora roreri]|nr:c-14 sterol reductase [Moniliophthora roreri]